MKRATIPVADYKALAPNFNPTQFNAAEIVGLAKAAEMKYIVFTSKHRDGFAIFDSKAWGVHSAKSCCIKLTYPLRSDRWMAIMRTGQTAGPDFSLTFLELTA
jgi:hypothetical protein